jgi:hypothetical protein
VVADDHLGDFSLRLVERERRFYFAGRGRGCAPISESWQHLRIDRVAGAQERRTAPRLLAALRDVRYAARGRRIGQASLGLRERCCASRRRYPRHGCRELNFGYMKTNISLSGFRRARLRHRANGPHLEAIPGTALGIMRLIRPATWYRSAPSANCW